MSKPSDTELTLLRCLWEHGRMSAREVHDASTDETGWSYSSTRKTLDRMVEKGLIGFENAHGIKVFEAREKKLATMARLIGDFSRNILGTDAPLPAAAFTGSKLISEDEIKELDALLKTLAKGEDKS